MEKRCSGCGGCLVVCPRQCISLKINNKGFYKADIDKENCVNCGLCEKICPINNIAEGNELDESQLYSAYSCDKMVRKNSSSGGIAYLMAEFGLKNNYIICGSTYDYSSNQAKHIIIDNVQDLYMIQGSKYLQSKTDIFKKIIHMGRKNKNTKFMVFGTPCQISALRKIVQFYKMEERFLLIDIFCHGVPSYLLWNEYLSWIKIKGMNTDNIKSICFRDKEYSWHEYYMHIVTDEREYIASRKKDPFLKIFTMGVMNQKECFSCQYRNKSLADIRLGDYWGDRYKKSEEGYSMVLLNTKNGREIFKHFTETKNIVYKEMPITDRLGQQHSDYPVPQYYEKSFVLLNNKNSMRKIINLYDPIITRVKRRMKETIKSVLIKLIDCEYEK